MNLLKKIMLMTTIIVNTSISMENIESHNINFDEIFTETFDGKVHLSGGKANDDVAKQLGEFLKTRTDIIELDLERNTITDKGIMHLAEGLQNNQSLKVLNLNLNKITSVGAEQIIQLLKTNASITSLNLAWNPLSLETIKKIVSTYKDNNIIEFLDLRSESYSDQILETLIRD